MFYIRDLFRKYCGSCLNSTFFIYASHLLEKSLRNCSLWESTKWENVLQIKICFKLFRTYHFNCLKVKGEVRGKPERKKTYFSFSSVEFSAKPSDQQIHIISFRFISIFDHFFLSKFLSISKYSFISSTPRAVHISSFDFLEFWFLTTRLHPIVMKQLKG